MVTDHKPLLSILGSKAGIPPLAAARLQRWALILLAYQYDLIFKKTQDHGNADALSRLPLATEEKDGAAVVAEQGYRTTFEDPSNTHTQIRQATRNDPVLTKVITYLQTGWPSNDLDPSLKPFQSREAELTIDE